MKRWSAWLGGGVLCAVALAQSGPALLLEQTGSVTGPGGQQLSRGKQCPPGLYTLAAGSSFTVRFRNDGHRERTAGSGKFKLQEDHLEAVDPGVKVERSSFRARTLTGPALVVYTQGGQVSTPSGSGAPPSPITSPGRPITAPPPPPPPPPPSPGKETGQKPARQGAVNTISRHRRRSLDDTGSAAAGAVNPGRGGLPPIQDEAAEAPGAAPGSSARVPPPPPPPPELASDLTRPESVDKLPVFQLQNSAAGWSLLPGAAVAVDGAVLQLTDLADQSVTDVSSQLRERREMSLPAEGADLYRLDLRRGAQHSAFTYRRLSTEEAQELFDLEHQTALDSEQNLERMKAFARLGLFHLAAAEARSYLNTAFSPDQAVAGQLLGWYRHQLRDAQAEAELLQLFREQGWPVPDASAKLQREARSRFRPGT